MVGPGPRYTVRANQPHDNIHERNPSWCVALIRFLEPASSYSSPVSLTQTKPLIVVENDCIGVQINRPKDSFAKTASLTFKITNVYYANAVSPGDWVMIWMSDYQSDIDRIIAGLYGNDISGKLINWDSGLKFMGRVIEVGDVDDMTLQGVRTQVQSISCQMFLEFATSVYYTYLSKAIINPGSASPSNSADSQDANPQGITDQEASAILTHNQLNTFLKGRANDSFLQNFVDKLYFYPDNCVAYNFIMTMGIPAESNFVNQQGVIGEFSDAITVPRLLSGIMGQSGSSRLWQLYQVYLGIQQYQGGAGDPWEKFMPITNDGDDVFRSTPYRCKGFVPFYPMQWDNQALWTIMNQYLNPVVNEMYTALRINDDNQIMPTLVVREAPFGTGLYNLLQLGMLGTVPVVQAGQNNKTPTVVQQIQQSLDDTDTTITVQNQTGQGYLEQSTVRTMYHNMPRWVIDESMVNRVDTRVSESDRINFVQVWGRSSGAEYAGVNQGLQQEIKTSQFAQGNYCADTADITRNGLRANITESVFDVISGQNGSQAPYWARMRADRYFNGHLMLKGTVQCSGIQEPICEGDNCEVRGIVYHLEGVTFSGSIDTKTGNKQFNTTLTVSHGLLAKNLNGYAAPLYQCHVVSDPVFNNGPGITEIQAITGRNPETGEPQGSINGATKTDGSK